MNRLARWTCWSLAGLAALLIVGASLAYDAEAPLSRVEVLMDPTGSKTLAQIQASTDWTPERNTVVRGFSESAMWVRLWVDPKVAGSTWFLRVTPSYLDEVFAYLPNEDGMWVEYRSGDTVSANRHQTSDTAIAFVWTPGTTQHVDRIYLRIKSNSVLLAHINLLGPEEYFDARDRQHTAAGVLAGLMLTAMAWSLFHAFGGSGSLFGLYFFYLLCSLGLAMGSLGYVARYVSPQSTFANSFTTASGLTASLAGMMFHRQFLRSLGRETKAMWVLEIGVVVAVVNLLTFAAGWTRIALSNNIWLILFYTTLVLPTLVVLIWRNVDRLNRLLLLVYSIVPVTIAFTLMPFLRILPPGPWSGYGGSIYGLMTATVLAAALAIGQRRQTLLAQEAELQAIRAQAEADAVRSERDDKDRFLAMLAHESRNHMSVVRMVLEMTATEDLSTDAKRQLVDRALNAIEDMDSLVERAVQVDRMERNIEAVVRSAVRLAELVEIIRLQFSEKDRIAILISSDLLPVSLDPVVTRVILFNLLDNALSYSPPGSLVEVTATGQVVDGFEGTVVSVRNQTGIAGSPDPDKVFEKYYRSDGARRTAGSGLGLYLSAGLARMIGARLVLRKDVAPDQVIFELWISR